MASHLAVRRRALAALSAVLLAATVGCGSSGGAATPAAQNASAEGPVLTGADKKAARGGSLTFALTNDPQNFNPYSSAVDNLSIAVYNSWWEYLIRPDGKGGFEPRLAERYEVSPDEKTYTFFLRRGVTFHNGDPFTAADVKFSLDKAFGAKDSLAAFLGETVRSVEAVDDATVRITLDEPYPYLLDQLGGFTAAILPSRLVKRDGLEALLKKPVGTGPFIFKSRDPGSSLTVERNPDYWEKGYPRLDAITYRVFADDNARATAVQDGRADLAEQPPRNQLLAFGKNAQLQVFSFPSSQVEVIAVNTRREPFDDARVRQAISLAINREAIVKSGLFGFGAPANTFLANPPNKTFRDPELDLYPYDPAKAKRLLQQAGVRPGSLRLGISNDSVQEAIASVMEPDLRKLGFDVKLVRKDLPSTDGDIIGGDYDLNTTFWGNLVADPTVAPQFWNVSEYCCESYFTGLDDPALERIVDKAIASPDREAAKPAFEELQRAVAKSAHVLPLYYPSFTYLANDKVGDFRVDPFGSWNVDRMGLAR